MQARPQEQPFAVRFFDEEFRRRISAGAHQLNPREALVLPHVRGSVLELGCGLGNLSLEAAKRGCSVTSVDASRVAVRRLRGESKRLGSRIRVVAADVENFRIDARYDTVACISLLMFFDRDRARSLLRNIQGAVAPGGIAAVSVLTEGTTYLEMFDPTRHYLFARTELESSFRGWDLVEVREDDVPAPNATRKRFSTVIARRS